ncbi:MAG: hypothetical protein WAO20_04195, partial [Acidobacteriota bacterium]
TLLEVLVAMAVATVALVAAVGLLAASVRLAARLREGADATLQRWNRVQEIRAGIEEPGEGAEWIVPADGCPPLRRFRVVDGLGRCWEVFRYDGSTPAGE